MSRAVAAVDRSRLPGLRPVPRFAFPAIDEVVAAPTGCASGRVRHAAVPVVALPADRRRGAADDPTGQEGLAALTADMLDEGSGDWSAIEMHEELARIGAQFDIDIGADATLVGVTALNRFAERGARAARRHRRAARASPRTISCACASCG